MKLGIIITQTDAETVFNALRLALFSLQQGDEVSVFLSGKGVEIDRIEDTRFDVRGAGAESARRRRQIPRLWNVPEIAGVKRLGTVPAFDVEGSIRDHQGL